MNLTLLVSIAVAMPQQYPSATVHHWIIVYTADMMICHTNVQQLIINLVVLGRGGGDSRRCFAVVSCFRFRSKKHTHTHTCVPNISTFISLYALVQLIHIHATSEKKMTTMTVTVATTPVGIPIKSNFIFKSIIPHARFTCMSFTSCRRRAYARTHHNMYNANIYFSIS